MKHVKTYEDILNNAPLIVRHFHRKKYKYRVDDLVIFKKLKRIFKVNNINLYSDTQDYYLINPLNDMERGWVTEEELKTPTEEQLNELETEQNSKKYNL